MVAHLGAGCRRFARCTFGGPARIVVLAMAFAGLSRAQTPGVYRIDPQASRIEIHLFRGGLLGGFGDNHLILLTRFSGTAEAPEGRAWEVHVLGESGSLVVADPGVSPSTREQVQRTMLGPTQLDVTRYPAIEVRSRALLPGEADKSWRMLADLTLHGVSRQVELPLAWNQSRDRLRVWGKKKLWLRDFKIQPARVALGTIQVRNDFELVYDITLREKP